MTNKQLLTVHATIYFIFAIVLFFIPDVFWPLYGMEINDQYARFLSQHNSIFLGGVAILSWMLRDAGENSVIARKFITGLLWTNGLGVVITLYACITGAFSGVIGWSDPAFFTFMSVLCVLQLRKN